VVSFQIIKKSVVAKASAPQPFQIEGGKTGTASFNPTAFGEISSFCTEVATTGAVAIKTIDDSVEKKQTECLERFEERRMQMEPDVKEQLQNGRCIDDINEDI
jgi:hypothetical protein